VRRTSEQLPDEALLMLEGRGAVLETARHVSRILLAQHVPGAVIGGVSVTLHGHVRATSDVDVYVPERWRHSQRI
jgi:predicted nucleotidyltransferase